MDSGRPSTYEPTDLYSSISALDGGEIISICEMPAEIARQVKSYILVKVRHGQDVVRVILVGAEALRPCPVDLDMWDHMDFFTMDELKARRLGHALELPNFEEDFEVSDEQ